MSYSNMDHHFHIKPVRIFLVICSICVVSIGCLFVVLQYDGMLMIYKNIISDSKKNYSGEIHVMPVSKQTPMLPTWTAYERNETTRNISSRIANFVDQNEKLFIYGELLQREHNFNRRYIESLRQEIHQELGTNITNLLFLTKENSPIGTKVAMKTRKSFLNVSSAIYEKLPQKSTFDRINRCSVVGNSGALLKSKCGRQIDAADFVYRCNAAPLEPFAADAGIKSNITSFNPSIFRKRYKGISKESYFRKFLLDMRQYHGYIWGPCLNRNSDLRTCIKAMNGYNISENQFVLAHPDHFKYIRDFWTRRGKTSAPSTGFYYTSDAISRCNEIHLYGFWPFPRAYDGVSAYNVSYHYFEELRNAWKVPHEMNKEFSFLVQLHLLGIIKVHNGKCG